MTAEKKPIIGNLENLLIEGGSMAIVNVFQDQDRGQDLVYEYTHKPSECGGSVDISGWSFRVQLILNDVAIVDKTTDIDVAQAASGIISVLIKATDTDGSFAAGKYTFRFWRDDVGNKRVLARGFITFL